MGTVRSWLVQPIKELSSAAGRCARRGWALSRQLANALVLCSASLTVLYISSSEEIQWWWWWWRCNGNMLTYRDKHSTIVLTANLRHLDEYDDGQCWQSYCQCTHRHQRQMSTHYVSSAVCRSVKCCSDRMAEYQPHVTTTLSAQDCVTNTLINLLTVSVKHTSITCWLCVKSEVALCSWPKHYLLAQVTLFVLGLCIFLSSSPLSCHWPWATSFILAMAFRLKFCSWSCLWPEELSPC